MKCFYRHVWSHTVKSLLLVHRKQLSEEARACCITMLFAGQTNVAVAAGNKLAAPWHPYLPALPMP